MRNVGLVAIAKDEAPYLHEFIHHHIYFGFKKILIAINRTTDESGQVLKKITSVYDNVGYINVDWIDKVGESKNNSNLQPYAIAMMVEAFMAQNKQLTDVCILDIDEFWFPSDFKKSIASFLSVFPNYDSVCFNWLCQSGDNKNFSKPFENGKAISSPEYKSLIKIESLHKVIRYTAHGPYFNESGIKLDANMNRLTEDEMNNYRTDQVPEIGSMDAWILHRQLRSEPEYLNLLFRSIHGDFKIKRNRLGFDSGGVDLNLDKFLLDKYHKSLDDFVKNCDLEERLFYIRESVLKEADFAYKIPKNDFVLYPWRYVKSLRGTQAADIILPAYVKFASTLQLVECIDWIQGDLGKGIKNIIIDELTKRYKESNLSDGLNKPKNLNPEDEEAFSIMKKKNQFNLLL